MRGIFKFFGGCSAWSLQQRSAKTTAKTPQRRHKDGRTNRKGPRMLQRWTRPHWRYIVLIPPVRPCPSLQPFLEAKPHIFGIFADLCKDLQRCRKDAIFGSRRIEDFQNFMGAGVFVCFRILSGAGFSKKKINKKYVKKVVAVNFFSAGRVRKCFHINAISFFLRYLNLFF